MNHSISAQLSQLPLRNSIPRQANIFDYEIVEMAVLLRSGEFTSVQLTEAYLQRIERLNGPFETYDANGGYNAFVRIDAQEALEQARAADAWLASRDDPRGPAPPLCGIPIGVKDSIAIQGRESRNGSLAYSGNVALRDATAVERLRQDGAVLLGHTICSAHSLDVMGTFAGNAWDPARVPGGSSQGSGVAPMARLAAAAVAEETGGSLIIPAAANGASGIKPSLGYISTAGVMPLTTGVDVVGSIARSMRDAALLINTMAGVDQRNDALTLSAPIPLPLLSLAPTAGSSPLRGLTIGIPQVDSMTGGYDRPPADTYDKDYLNAFERFKAELRTLGAQVMDFPWLDADLSENQVFYNALPLLEIELPPPYATWPATPLQILSYANQYETEHWQAVHNFAMEPERSEAHREELLGLAKADHYHAMANAITVPLRAEAEKLRRAQQALNQQALDDAGIDFMLVMPLGAHIHERFSPAPTIPNMRFHYPQPNSLGWPMVTFPIAHGTNGGPLVLPINAAFWGPRFSEPLLVQAAIDYQAHYAYNRLLPADPVFDAGCYRPLNVPRVRVAPPHESADPIAFEKALRP